MAHEQSQQTNYIPPKLKGGPCSVFQQGVVFPCPSLLDALCFSVTSSTDSFCHSFIPLCLWHLRFLFIFTLLLSPLCQDKQDGIVVVASVCLWLNKMRQSWRNCRNIVLEEAITVHISRDKFTLYCFISSALNVMHHIILKIVFDMFLYCKETFITCCLCICGVKKGKI